MGKLFKLNPLILALAAVVLGVAAYLFQIPFTEDIELRTIDLRFRYRGAIPPGDKVVLAVIDEKSVNQEGKWVWPRAKFTALVRKLSEAGARVVAFDIGFLEQDDRRVVETIGELQRQANRPGAVDDRFKAYLDGLARSADSDRQFAEAIAASRASIVLGYFFHMSRQELAHLNEADAAGHQERVRRGVYPFVRYTSANAQSAEMIQAVLPQSNIEVIARAAPYAGYFNMFPDPDGVVRWIPAVIKFNEALYAPLSLKAVGAYLDAPLSVQVADHGIEAVHIGRQAVPTDELGRIPINYRGPARTFPHLSITDILHDRIQPDALRDKIVMVGATAVGIYDLRVTPFGSVFPGLEIHANVVDSILARDFLWHPSWAAIFDLLAMALMGAAAWFFLTRSGVVTGALAALLLFGGYIGLCQALFVTQGWILNIVYPLIVLVLAYVGITALKYLAEARQKKFIRSAFSTYLAPSVVKQLIDSPESLVLGGEEREITAFFSDIQGFTGISEKLSAKELVELLNEFLTEMTDIILHHEGTVDKFEGDAIIAFFGAPNQLPNHAAVACRACFQMQVRLAELRQRWRAAGRPELKMRIGLNTGVAVVGNMGSRQRMDYTMMGDSVNIAARLEGVNKVYGTYTMVSASTFAKVADEFIGRELDAINVVGKAEPVAVYELIGPAGEVPPQTLEVVALYGRGLEAYRRRDWTQAIAFFDQALTLTPDDAPSRTMADRSRRYQDNPPPEDWNGAFAMTSK
jgi:adenylate cyclase